MIKPTQIDWSIPGTFGKLQAIYCHVGLSLDHATCDRYGDRYGESALYGTVSAKIAPRLKCYKNASRLNRYNFPTDSATDFLFSTLHSEMV